MEFINARNLIKRIIAFTIIISMAFSYFMPFAKFVKANTVNEYVKFDANWENGTKEINTQSNTGVISDFDIKLNTVSTGFQNLKLLASSVQENGTESLIPVITLYCNNEYVKQNGNGVIEFVDTVNGGIDISGTVSVVFPRSSDFETYNKKVNLLLTGSYIDPETKKVTNIYETVTLNANVSPKSDVKEFEQQLTLVSKDTKYDQQIIYEDNRNVGDRKIWFEQKYELGVVLGECIQNSELNITINKTSAVEPKMVKAYTISFPGLENKFGTPEKTGNSDGSVTYTFKIGKESDEFNKDECINKSYNFIENIVVRYNTNYDDFEIGNYIGIDANYYMVAELKSNGWKTVQSTADNIEAEKKSLSSIKRVDNSINVYDKNTGLHSWISVGYNVRNNKNITSEQIEKLLNNENIDLKYSVAISSIWAPYQNDQDALAVIEHDGLKLQYYSDDKEVKILNIDASIMNVKEIVANSILNTETSKGQIVVYDSNNNDDSIAIIEKDGKFENTNNILLPKFKIGLTNFLDHANKYYGYDIVYSLSGSKLKELGLSDSEIRNIISIGNSIQPQVGTKGSLTGSMWIKGGGSAYINNNNSQAYEYSYMELDINEQNTNIVDSAKEKRVIMKLSMNHNYDVIDSGEIKNVNPKIYMKLPSDFNYRINSISLEGETNGKLVIKNYKKQKINNDIYIIIDCEGTYTEDLGTVNIVIDTSRTAKNVDIKETQTIEAYLLTDNENYITNEDVSALNFEKNDKKVSEALKISKTFLVEKDNVIEIKNRINNKELRGIGSVLTIDNPYIIQTNDTIKYQVFLYNGEKNITDVQIINRLPYMENKSIINNINLDSNISLTNLKNIKVYKNGEELANTEYTLQYSTDLSAGVNSQFTNIEDSTDLSTIRTLKLLFKDGFVIEANSEISIQYEMDMPSVAEELKDNNKVATISYVSYIEQGKTEKDYLESSAAYVKNGELGTITLKKKFEGKDLGVAPDGLSLQGIEFRFINIDTNEVLVLDGQTDENGVVKTDVNGVITLKNVPNGKYAAEEISVFDNYKGIEWTEYNIENSSNEELIAENKLKLGNLNVQKNWEGSEEQQEVVTFEISRTDGIVYKATAQTDRKTGIATFIGIPYGTYNLKEISGKAGWYFEDITVDLFEEEKTIEVENKLEKGTLKLIKTVPITDEVNNLKFKVIGYANTHIVNSNNEVAKSNNIELIFKIASSNVVESVSSNYDASNVSVEIASDNKSATIILSNLPLGTYTIEEIDIPVLDGTDIEKFKEIHEVVELQEKEATVEVKLENAYKTGIINFEKTAKLGEDYISDLSQFSINISGTSKYGTKINKNVFLDEEGKASVEIEIGEYKITENAAKGYKTYYIKTENSQEVRTEEPPTINIEDEQVVTQKIFNDHVGKGYVKVIKTLETIEDAEKVKNMGIQFNVIGTNVAGKRVEEPIYINTVETIDGKQYAVGYSNAISIGGEYELEEVESTVPNFFESAENILVNLDEENTIDTPLVINVENPRGVGRLEITTKNISEPNVLMPITYQVTEIDLDNNGSYTTIGKSTILEGANGYAEISNLYAGYYLVEQVEVPAGYIVDVPQIVEVPNKNTGYAEFEISKPKELRNTTVIIEKEIFNKNGEIAKEEDFANALLNSNESFEIKITNVNTKKVYYAFINSVNNAVIKGLDAGTYEIEEIYKPKYLTKAFMIKQENEYVELVENEGKITFTIDDVQSDESIVNLKIQNTINTDFGFGGQDSKDNYSKVNEEQVNLVTKTIVNVTDEDGKALSNVAIKIYDNNNNEVQIPYANNTYILNGIDTRVIIKGLPVGTFKLKVVNVPEGYLIPEDRNITVYGNATQVTSIEIQKNIPRGDMLLSTTYTLEDDSTRYLSKSAYKVVNSETGDLVGFTKTLTGDYVKSNLDSALTTIPVKQGIVKLKGIEAGNYEVGIVEVKDGYGIIKEEPEFVSIEQNKEKNINVEVEKVGIIDAQSGYNSTMYLDVDGRLWVFGSNSYGVYGNGTTSSEVNEIAREVMLPEDVKITKFDLDQVAVAIDEQGRVWCWGSSLYGIVNGTVTESLVCITDKENSEIYNAYQAGTRFVDIHINYNTVTLLDNNGKVWHSGSFYDNSGRITPSEITCLNDRPDNILYGVQIDKLYNESQYAVARSTDGNLYLVANGNCITDDESISFRNKQIEKFFYAGNMYAYDSENTLWWGDTYNGFDSIKIEIKDMAESNNTLYIIDKNNELWKVPSYGGELTKVDDTKLKGVNINSIDSGSDDKCIALTSDGKLLGWNSYSYYGECGSRANDNKLIRFLTQTYSKNLEYNLQFEKVAVTDDRTIALDSEGNVWRWGDGNYMGKYNLNIVVPEKIVDSEIGKVKDIGATENYTWLLNNENRLFITGYVSYIIEGSSNIYNFAEITIPNKIEKVVGTSYNLFILDKDGAVWSAGQNSYGMLGSGTSDTYMTRKEFLQIEAFKDLQIVDICVSNSCFVALDSEGKVWYCGNNNELTDINQNSYIITPICLTDIETSSIYGIKMKKISAKDEYDNSIGLLDENGNAWIRDCNKDIFVKVNDITEGTNYIKQLADSNEGYKIIDIKAIDSGYYLKDSLNNSWFVGQGELLSSVVSSSSNITVMPLVNEDRIEYIKDVDRFASSSSYTKSVVVLIDNNGKLWTFGGNPGSTSTNGAFACIMEDKSNILYGKKASEVYFGQRYPIKYANGTKLNVSTNTNSNSIILQENGKLYSINANGGAEVSKNDIDALGVKFVKTSLSSSSAGTHYGATRVNDGTFVGLDENGKLWTNIDTENGYIGIDIFCINDKPGTKANEAQLKDSNFKFVDFTCGEVAGRPTYLAIDNSGEIWGWYAYDYNSAYNQGITGYYLNSNSKMIYTDPYNYFANVASTSSTAQNISELINAKNTYSDFKFISVEIKNIYRYNNIAAYVIARDNHNGVWVWGNNYNQQFGSGYTTTGGTFVTANKYNYPHKINADGTALAKEGTEIVDVITNGFSGIDYSNGTNISAFAITNKGEIYKLGTSYTKNVNFNNYYISVSEEYLYFDDDENIYVYNLGNLNKVWSHVRTIEKNEQFDMKEVKEDIIIDSNNNVWQVVKNGSKYEAICLTTKVDSKAYGIKMEKIITKDDIVLNRRALTILKDLDGNIWEYNNSELIRAKDGKLGSEAIIIYGEATEENMEFLAEVRYPEYQQEAYITVGINQWDLSDTSDPIIVNTRVLDLSKTLDIVDFADEVAITSDGKVYVWGSLASALGEKYANKVVCLTDLRFIESSMPTRWSVIDGTF